MIEDTPSNLPPEQPEEAVGFEAGLSETPPMAQPGQPESPPLPSEPVAMDEVMDEAGRKSRRIIGLTAAGTAAVGAGVAAALLTGVGSHDAAPKPEVVATTQAKPTNALSPVMTTPVETQNPTPAVTPTTIETPKVTHTAVIQPPKSEQSHVNNTSPTATKSPEKPQTNFEAQLSQYAQAVGSNGESLASAPDWTKSVKGNMETFSRPASLQNNDSADGKYQLILVRDASGKITEAMWRTLAVSKDQGNTVVLDSFDLTKDGAWVGTATHYTGNGSQVETYKGQQWNNDTVQTFEEKMDNVGNNATTNPPKPLVYPS